MNAPAAPAAPVMRIARRRAKPGCAEAYVALVQGMFADARQLPGFLGAELIAPAEDDGEYQVVFRFNTQSDMDRWDSSPQRALWHRRLRAVAEGDPEYRLLSGLEAWFALPQVPVGRPPQRWKMALLTWLGIFPTVSLLLAFVAPHLTDLPFLPRTAVITGLVVLIMTWGVMPRLVPRFQHWLTKR
jgi:antibiotic biosynthesis monooxygenase (ABM) superfamily enzyme